MHTFTVPGHCVWCRHSMVSSVGRCLCYRPSRRPIIRLFPLQKISAERWVMPQLSYR